MNSIFGGSVIPKCQCPNNTENGKDKPCKRNALEGKLFCKQHMKCRAAPINGSEPKKVAHILNKSKAYLETNNCLSYAVRGNKINMDLVKQCIGKNGCSANFEQPGAASGKRKAMRNETLRTCPVVKSLTKSDLTGDFVESSFTRKCKNGFSKVALVVDEGTDYHWYRQDPDGFWSHKDGSNPVKYHDALKRRIFNPKQASRNYGNDLNYEDFCGFFCVNRNKTVNLKQGGKRRGKRGGGVRKTLKQSRRSSDE